MQNSCDSRHENLMLTSFAPLCCAVVFGRTSGSPLRRLITILQETKTVAAFGYVIY